MAYTGKQLDQDVVNPNQIRLIIQSVRDHLPKMFTDRYMVNSKGEQEFEVPKTLIFAKSDSHADDIINIVREEFGEENKFCKKITYNTEDPKGVLTAFRNNYYPRIAVTVDMIATGTDIRPLEVLLFLRDVKSRSYYEQMKGMGTRTCSLEELRILTKVQIYFIVSDKLDQFIINGRQQAGVLKQSSLKKVFKEELN